MVKKIFSLFAVLAMLVQGIAPSIIYANDIDHDEDTTPVVLTTTSSDDDIDLSGFQKFTLASGGVCSLNDTQDKVYPDFTPDATSYGYYLTITDKSNNTDSNYIYYAGATNTPVDICADTVTVNIPVLGSQTVTDGQIIPINLGFANVNLTVTKTGSEPSCSYSLAGTTSEVAELINKNLCQAIDGSKWTRTKTEKKCVWGLCSDVHYGTCSLNIDTTATLNSQANYIPNTFNITTLSLPNITPENASGYAVEFFPLTLSNTSVGTLELLNLNKNEWVVVDATLAAGLALIPGWQGSSAGVCGIGTELPTVTTPGGGIM